MLTVLGFAMVITIVVCLLKKWLNPTVAFILIPPIFAILAGIPVNTVGDFAAAGIEDIFDKALITIVCCMYFSLVSEAGLFDPAADFFVKKCKIC